MVKIFNQSVEEFCKSYRGEKFAALFCDAPYSLGDGKKGFMNKEWDNNIAMQPDTWRALAEHLLPGAFLFVFAGTLNDDLISVAMRQAGLRKFHKAVLYWGFSSGFPKASRIDVAVDRAAGTKRNIIRRRNDGVAKTGISTKRETKNEGVWVRDFYETAPATPLAKTWAGHRYGLQSLKPAAETILIFQKNYDGKPVDSITKNGSGALNVDGARIKTNDLNGKVYNNSKRHGNDIYGGGKGIPQIVLEGNSTGRWPANLILQHSELCEHENCFKGIEGEVPVFCHKNASLSFLTSHESLLDRLKVLLEDIHCYGKNGKVLFRNACEAFCSENKLSVDFSDGLFGEVWNALTLTKLQDFQFCCLPCCHFYDELLHLILSGGLNSSQSLHDALFDIYSETIGLLYNRRHRNFSRLSISDGFPQLSSFSHKTKNNTLSSLFADKILFDNKHKPSYQDSLTSNSIYVNKTGENGKHETHDHTSCNIALVKSLCILSFDLAYNILSDTMNIQKHRIVVNLNKCPVRELDEQSGILKSGSGVKNSPTPRFGGVAMQKSTTLGNGNTWDGDTGGASKFFFNADWNYEAAEKIEQAAGVRYCAKASRRERDAGLENYSIKDTGHRHGKYRCKKCGKLKLDYKPCICKEPEFERMDNSKNPHPTVKPLSLCKYLATLLLPPADYAPRRILIPFAGVASEAIGAMLAGWEEIVAVEKEKDYCDIGKARVKYWQTHKEPKAKLKKKIEASREVLQETLF